MMKIKMKHVPFAPVFLALLLLATILIEASAQNPSHHIPSDLVEFFLGEWEGHGQFASGKEIAADVSFKMSLDDQWLMYEHTDREPNKYKALSVWGVDGQTGEFVAYSFNNFQGHKRFLSNGWQNGKLILSRGEHVPGRGTFFEHFIYEKINGSSFKMTYETSRDGIEWKMIDSLVFERK